MRQIRTHERQGGPRIPIIMLTVLGNRDDLTTALSVGVDDYIIKIPTRDVLKTKIKRVLGLDGMAT